MFLTKDLRPNPFFKGAPIGGKMTDTHIIADFDLIKEAYGKKELANRLYNDKMLWYDALCKVSKTDEKPKIKRPSVVL